MGPIEPMIGNPTPDWFWPAVETEARADSVEVADCEVCYRCWGDPGKPALLLAHGMHAHSHWWDFIAPHFLDDYYVVAPDFTGMGDSDYRYDYTPALFADEIAAVIDHAGINQAVLVGHSFGGFISVIAAHRRPEKISKLILVDSAVSPPKSGDDEEEEEEGQNIMAKGGAIFPDAKTARARFRLQPPQPCANTYLIQYIARHSIMRVDAGWTWKFDEDLRDALTNSRPENAQQRYQQAFKELHQPFGLIYGEQSHIFKAETIPYMQSLRRQPFPVVALKDAHHHLFMDQPIAFVDALRKMIAALSPV